MHEFNGTFLLMLSQDMQAQPPAPDERSAAPPPSPGTTAAPGGPGNSAPLGSPGGGVNQILMPVIIVCGMLLVFSMLGQRKDRKKREAMISAIKKHDRVQTSGGIIGSVVEVKPEYVVLKVDESTNTRITFARSAVLQVLSVGPETASGPGTANVPGTTVGEKAA